MANSSDTDLQQSRSFDPPQEAEWHRMIAEAAYHLAEKRGFAGDHSLEDWLAAEQQVRHLISAGQAPHRSTVVPHTEQAGDATGTEQSKPPRRAPRAKGPSRLEKFGDVRNPDKRTDEKPGANRADRS